MWVVILEMIFALGLAAFIVWWTWPKKPRKPDAGKQDENVGADKR